MRDRRSVIAMRLGTALLGAAWALVLALPAEAALTKCHMKYSLDGWAAFYESASGTGTITCENGQSAKVKLRAKGGGITAGRTKVVGGEGSFSAVGDIAELFGVYVGEKVAAGAGDSAEAQLVTKGTVSLALSGTGKGIALGVSFGEFVIEKYDDE